MPLPHKVHGTVFAKRAECKGPVQDLYGEDADDWSSCMVFKCIYGCDRISIPYNLLENHVVNECP